MASIIPTINHSDCLGWKHLVSLPEPIICPTITYIYAPTIVTILKLAANNEYKTNIVFGSGVITHSALSRSPQVESCFNADFIIMTDSNGSATFTLSADAAGLLIIAFTSKTQPIYTVSTTINVMPAPLLKPLFGEVNIPTEINVTFAPNTSLSLYTNFPCNIQNSITTNNCGTVTIIIIPECVPSANQTKIDSLRWKPQISMPGIYSIFLVYNSHVFTYDFEIISFCKKNPKIIPNKNNFNLLNLLNLLHENNSSHNSNYLSNHNSNQHNCNCGK